MDDEQQRVQVQTLHQQPEEVGHDKVVKEHQDGFTAHLHTHTHTLNVIYCNTSCHQGALTVLSSYKFSLIAKLS